MQRPETRAADVRGRLPREGIVEAGEVDRFAFAQTAARVAQRVVREAREVRREWVRSLELQVHFRSLVGSLGRPRGGIRRK